MYKNRDDVMMEKLRAGGLSWSVVLAVHRLRGDAYGVTIRRDIAERMGKDVSFGAIYTTLSRLERDGLMRSREGDPTPKRGGRAKRFYELTGHGISALQASAQEIESLRTELVPGAVA
jgi:PadR family transcriptional regulator, regulatory protein PadR